MSNWMNVISSQPTVPPSVLESEAPPSSAATDVSHSAIPFPSKTHASLPANNR